MKWFKHFSKAREDRSVEKLIAEFGIAGYGLYFYCLEVIVGSVDSENITFELEPDAELLARRLGMDTILVEKIMHRCVELDLFEISDGGRITCFKIGKYLEKAITRNSGIIKIIDKIRDSPGQSGTIPDCPAQKRIDENRSDQKRIEKEIKEEEGASRPSPRKNKKSEDRSTLPEYGDGIPVHISDDEMKALKKKYDDYNIQDYIRRLSYWEPQKGTRPKNEYLAILRWMNKDKVPMKAQPEPPCPLCGGRVTDGLCRNSKCERYGGGGDTSK